MVNAGSVVAHLFKLAVTLICMRYIESSYSIFANGSGWAVRAFQILLVHSVLGILTFGKNKKKIKHATKEKIKRNETALDASPSVEKLGCQIWSAVKDCGV